MNSVAPAFERLRELNEAVALLSRSGQSIPAVMLTYSAIDILGSLSRPDPKQDATGIDFQNWVSTFMLPGSQLTTSALDLWAARCGFLHCLSPYSSLSRRGKAQEICYTLTRESSETANAAAKTSGQKVIVVFVPDFLGAYFIGAQRFAEKVEHDSSFRVLFDANSEHLFGVL